MKNIERIPDNLFNEKGLDITTDHFDKFQSIVIQNKIENCFYRVQDIERNIPLDQFDRIISFEVIEHLQNENSVSYYYKSLKEVLPSGKFKDLVVRYFFNSDITRIPFKSTSIFIVAKK